MLKNQKNSGLWEYIWGITLKEYLSVVRWDCLAFIIIFPVVGYSMYSWFGLALGWAFSYLMSCAENGAVADVWNEFPPEEYPPNTCSAGIEGCKICDNEYSHDFNVRYNQNLKWYERIF